jgi:hypothetical protein
MMACYLTRTGMTCTTHFAPAGLHTCRVARAYSTQYTVHSTQYTVHSTQYTVHSTQYTVHSTQYTVHSTQYTVHSTLTVLSQYSHEAKQNKQAPPYFFTMQASLHRLNYGALLYKVHNAGFTIQGSLYRLHYQASPCSSHDAKQCKQA